MSPPSNPRLMSRVLDAILQLSEKKGSNARDVLDFIRQTSKSPSRNLTMQVHRALKHAVNAGLLRHRSGRYKSLFTLNPSAIKQSASEDNNQRLPATAAFNQEELAPKENPVRRVRSTVKRRKQRRGRKSRRSRSRDRRPKGRNSESPRKYRSSREHREVISKKRIYKDKGKRERTPRYKLPSNKMRIDIGNSSSSTTNHRKSKARKTVDRTYSSDHSDSSDYERNVKNQRNKQSDQVSRSTPARQESKQDNSGKSNKRSASRNRSPQRQQQHQNNDQQLQLQLNGSLEDVDNRMESDDQKDSVRNVTPDREIDKNREPDNSGSGSTL